MTTVAFPAGYEPNRASKFIHDTGVSVIPMLDRTEELVAHRVKITTFAVQIKNILPATWATLETFLDANPYNRITWTIDGNDYTGFFEGGYTYSRRGERYTVTFNYVAEKI